VTTEKQLTTFIAMLWKVNEQLEHLTKFAQTLVTENREMKKQIEPKECKHPPLKDNTMRDFSVGEMIVSICLSCLLHVEVRT